MRKDFAGYVLFRTLVDCNHHVTWSNCHTQTIMWVCTRKQTFCGRVVAALGFGLQKTPRAFGGGGGGGGGVQD